MQWECPRRSSQQCQQRTSGNRQQYRKRLSPLISSVDFAAPMSEWITVPSKFSSPLFGGNVGMLGTPLNLPVHRITKSVTYVWKSAVADAPICSSVDADLFSHCQLLSLCQLLTTMFLLLVQENYYFHLVLMDLEVLCRCHVLTRSPPTAGSGCADEATLGQRGG